MDLRTGDRVAYSVQFLRSIGESPTGELCHYRGEVFQVLVYGESEIAEILWDHDKYTREMAMSRVNVKNLAKVGPNLRFCAC